LPIERQFQIGRTRTGGAGLPSTLGGRGRLIRPVDARRAGLCVELEGGWHDFELDRVELTDGNTDSQEELLLVLRDIPDDHDGDYFFLSNAPITTPLGELARVALSPWRIDAAIGAARDHAGLKDYEGRTWAAWHHHQVLALVAAWLVGEYRRSSTSLLS